MLDLRQRVQVPNVLPSGGHVHVGLQVLRREPVIDTLVSPREHGPERLHPVRADGRAR